MAAPKGPSPQSRNWIFTLNNHSSVDVPLTLPNCRFVTWQEEIGESGTKHLQGYVIFKSPTRLSACKKYFPTAHWEIRQGTHQEAVNYCNKTDTRVSGPWTEGEPPLDQGFRSDLHGLKRAIDNGASDIECWNDFFAPMAKYHRGIQEYKRVRSMANPRMEKTVCIAIYGFTAAGKSHAVSVNAPRAYWLTKPEKGSQIWIDGYNGNSVFAIDEFYGWLPYDTLLRICDQFPLHLPTKGGFSGFAPKIIVITSNRHPDSWYGYNNFSGGYAPLKRRLEYIIEKKRDSYIVHQEPGSVDYAGVTKPGYVPKTYSTSDLWFTHLPSFPAHLHEYLAAPFPQATLVPP